jgi:hypothetical protein
MAKQKQPVLTRPPAVPLILHDPYFSIWSFSDHLAKEWSRHWTGTTQAISILVRVDGKTHRIMGCAPQGEPAEQTSLQVLPTRTLYRFICGDVDVQLTFTTPALCDDLDLLSRPVTYVTLSAQSRSKSKHAVQLCIDAGGQLATDSEGEPVNAARLNGGSLAILQMGATDQRMLRKSGDNLRIEWGYLYLAADAKQSTQAITFAETVRNHFSKNGSVPAVDESIVHHPVNAAWPTLAVAFDLGHVGSKAESRTLLVGYDDVFSIEYLNQKLRPYWRRNGASILDMLRAAAADQKNIFYRCETFDAKLMTDLTRAGGENYAALCALGYRQAIAAHKLVASRAGKPLFFSKENFSNGCIATVDVTYPSAPLFLLLQPLLLEGMLAPMMEYASLDRWKFPFAPHDLGQYPLANGQVYGGGERTEQDQMPVEESGNMLILCAALARASGSADFSKSHWKLLTKWAEYLAAKGLDPQEQLCTDDFAGHLAHNANLSLKALLGLACYAQLADTLGETSAAKKYRMIAEKMAKRWPKLAEDGDHTRLAFDQPGSWSQKYNLVWDKLLNLNLFPPSIAQREIQFYLRKQNDFGLPLDSRRSYTKLDWIVWTATLAEDEKDFRSLVDPLVDWLNTTPSRIPMTDWYDTIDGKQQGFQARSVVGGLFIKLLK